MIVKEARGGAHKSIGVLRGAQRYAELHRSIQRYTNIKRVAEKYIEAFIGHQMAPYIVAVTNMAVST